MYVRFEVRQRAGMAAVRAGIFLAAGDLEDTCRLDPASREELKERLAWFNREIPFPAKGCFRGEIGRCWFTPRARRMVRRAELLKVLMERHGLSIEIKYSQDPGLVTYNDRWQVVAVPRVI